ncbi:MAG: TatD family hydrolase [Leptospirales bacterium]|nr:TatD family hydrolase [Leptospirales bacterium]
MKLVDVHCHLEQWHLGGSLAGIVKEAADAGVVKMVTSSIEPAQWDISLNIAQRFEETECALGIHPWYILPEHADELPRLASFCKKGAIAVGEIGLDSKTGSTPIDLQKTFFEDQLAIARELDLPVIAHCRGSFYEMISSIKRLGKVRGIIHSFSGSLEIADKFIKLGFSFSMGGILTYRNSPKRAKLLKLIYPSHFLLETDSPDITPVEAKAPNTPANIVHNLTAAAEILETTRERVAAAATANAVRVLNLKL